MTRSIALAALSVILLAGTPQTPEWDWGTFVAGVLLGWSAWEALAALARRPRREQETTTYWHHGQPITRAEYEHLRRRP